MQDILNTSAVKQLKKGEIFKEVLLFRYKHPHKRIEQVYPLPNTYQSVHFYDR